MNSESIQRELSQLIVQLEGTTRSVDDARFRKIAMKSTEVLKGLRTLFERLGAEDQAKGGERPDSDAPDVKAGESSSAATGRESDRKISAKSGRSAKQNGTTASASEKRSSTGPAARAGKSGAARKAVGPTAAPGLAPLDSSALPTPAPKPEDPDEIAAKARLQRKEARAPKFPGGQTAPRPLPPQSGKPIWSKPHSS